MSKMDFEAGRQHGWTERDQYIIERQQAYGRSMFGWPMMAIGALIVLWCGLIFGLSGTQVVPLSTQSLLLVIGISVAILGWYHNRREREQQLHRIDDFEKRWGVQRSPERKVQWKLDETSSERELEPAE